MSGCRTSACCWKTTDLKRLQGIKEKTCSHEPCCWAEGTGLFSAVSAGEQRQSAVLLPDDAGGAGCWTVSWSIWMEVHVGLTVQEKQ